ncbi:hypothetical protein Tco_0569035 [Tanacetum coccineum]
MASMKYCDKHNQVGFLKKPEESVGFAEIVDFLKGSHIRYALTHNPTIHDSLVKQFWQTATASTLADGTLELRATIDTLEYTITEASVRNKLKLADASRISMGFRGVPRPLLPAMLPVVAVDQSAGQVDQAEDQPSSSEPLPSLSHPHVISATIASEPTPVAEPTIHQTSPSPKPDNEPTEHIFEQPSPEHQPLSPRQETKVPQSQDTSHPHVPEARTMTVEDLLHLHLVPNLIIKVDSLETELKQTKLTMGKAIMKLVKKVKKMEDILKRRHVVLTDLEDEEPEDQGRIFQDIDDDPLGLKGDFVTPTKPSGEAHEEEISPTTLEAAKTLSKVASHKSKLVDKVSTDSGPVSSARGQREGKASMIVEETQAPKRTKEQIQQEEASLAEAIRLQTLEEEETVKQVHFDALLAKRMEEEELTKQQKQRKAQVQFEAQHYTEEDWDAIRAKLEANVELTKSVLGKELSEEDFAKKMVELLNQRKKFFAKERAKARRSKPMIQSQLRNYVMNYLKNQETWKLTQLKKLTTKAQLKRYGEERQTEISKKQRIDDKDILVEEKVTEVKEEELVIRKGKRKKQKARKGINVEKSPQGDLETDEEELVEAMNPTPLDTKSNIVANWKIFQQDFTREDLIKRYRLVMQTYGTNRPEDVYDRVLWSNIRTMFDPPLNEDAIWSLPL